MSVNTYVTSLLKDYDVTCLSQGAAVVLPPPQSKDMQAEVFCRPQVLSAPCEALATCMERTSSPVWDKTWMDGQLPQLVSHLIPPHQTLRRVLLVFHETASD